MIYLDVLTEEGKELYPELSNFEGFYLAGGTALALQIGHRISVDFDFFSDKKIPKTLLLKIEEVYSDAEIEPSVGTPDELTIFIDGVKFSFIHYPFPVLHDLVSIDHLKLLSTKEIAATKAYTIGRREEYKDYVDLYASIHGGYTDLDEIMSLAEAKYAHAFNARLFLEQLLLVEDLEDTGIEFVSNPVSKEELKTFFEEKIKESSFTE